MSMTMEEVVDIALEAPGMTRARWDALLEAMKVDASMNEIMREDWRARPRDSEESIREYYRNSQIWFVNTFTHGVAALLWMANGERGSLSAWQEAFVEAIHAPQARILDYGGGLFQDTWAFVMAGHHVEVAEVRGPVTKFLKMFSSAAGLDGSLGVVEVDDDTPLLGRYDGIACFETLEHLLYPVAMAEHFRDHLAPGGPFAYSVSFGDTPHAPYHIASNYNLGNDGVWGRELGKLGFLPHWRDKVNPSFQIWRKA